MLELIWALGAIILIDVVLGGENAIVIAMASRRLPPDLRKQAMLWGTVGAVAVRFACVAALTYLLMIPGLRLIGGLALLYIAWQLVRDNNEQEHEVKAATTFWGAMATIVWADAVMGLDNALAIAGAAGGNWWLIIFGLLVSVPIILFGSTVVAKIMESWPRTIWLGAAVLVAVALQMIWAEPLLQEYLGTLSTENVKEPS
jgi:YjbE family integral membrane protein